jgi:hypothetical protein
MLADADAAQSLSSYGGVGHLYSDVFLLRFKGFGVTASWPSPKSTAWPLADGDGVGYGFDSPRLLADCRSGFESLSMRFIARRVDVRASSNSSSSSFGVSY